MADEVEPTEPPWKEIVEKFWERLGQWEHDDAPAADTRCVEDLDDILSGYEEQWQDWSHAQLTLPERSHGE